MRLAVAWVLIALLCTTGHGMQAQVVMSSFAYPGSEDSSEKTSTEQEDREASSKLFEVRTTVLRERAPRRAGRSVLGPVRGGRTQNPLSNFSLLSNYLGAGVRLRC